MAYCLANHPVAKVGKVKVRNRTPVIVGTNVTFFAFSVVVGNLIYCNRGPTKNLVNTTLRVRT